MPRDAGEIAYSLELEHSMEEQAVELGEARDRIEKLEAALRKIQAYAHHHSTCGHLRGWPPKPEFESCDCGFIEVDALAYRLLDDKAGHDFLNKRVDELEKVLRQAIQFHKVVWDLVEHTYGGYRPPIENADSETKMLTHRLLEFGGGFAEFHERMERVFGGEDDV